MSLVVHTPECFPERFTRRLEVSLPEQMPDHAACPAGFHVVGVLGGWHCPCPCHREAA